MFATVREGTIDPEKRRHGQAQIEELAALLARQPGYAGVVGVDAGDGRTLTVTLWESEAHATAAATAMAPEAQRLLELLGATRPQIIAQGPVIRSDLVKS